MQRALYFQLLGHVTAATHTAETFEDVAQMLKKAGFGAGQIKQGLELVHQGEDILSRRITDYVDDRNLEHAVHISTHEVEMWLQTVRTTLRKGGFDHESLDDAVGADLHSHDHTVTAIAQSMRAIGVLQTDEAVHACFGSERRVRDTMQRGLTLNRKLHKVANNLSAPSSICPKGEAIHGEIDALMVKMTAWLLSLEKSLMSASDDELIGLTGFVPAGIGLPLGGTATNVTLHENAQEVAPNPSDATVTSGWSVGRQGNRENIGQGWTPSTVE